MSTAPTPTAGTAAQLNTFFWRRLPVKAGRVSNVFGDLFADGAYLSNWPVMGGVVWPAALLIGFFIGWKHLDYSSGGEITYIYSAFTVVGLVLVSQLGAGIGIAVWLGFVLGDLSWVTSPEGLSTPLLGRLAARALVDVFLAGALIGIPVAARGVVRRLVKPSIRPDAFPVAAVLEAAVAFVLVYLWAMSTAVQMQAAFTWQGMTAMTHGLYNGVRNEAWAFAAAGAYGSAMRSVVEALAAHRPGQAERAAELRRELAAVRKPPSVPGSLIGAAVKAALMSLLFATYFTSWTFAFLIWVALAGVLILREALFNWMGMGATLRAKIPAVVRFPLAFVITLLISKFTVDMFWETRSFMPMILCVMFSIIIYAALLPERAAAKSKGA